MYKLSNEEANAPTTSSDTKFQMRTPEDIRAEEERIELRYKVYSKTSEGVQIIDLDLYEEVYGPPAESKDVSPRDPAAWCRARKAAEEAEDPEIRAFHPAKKPSSMPMLPVN